MATKILHIIFIGKGDVNSLDKIIPDIKVLEFLSDYLKNVGAKLDVRIIGAGTPDPSFASRYTGKAFFVDSNRSMLMGSIYDLSKQDDPVAYYDYTGNTTVAQTIPLMKENPGNKNRFYYIGYHQTNLQELIDVFDFTNFKFNSSNVLPSGMNLITQSKDVMNLHKDGYIFIRAMGDSEISFALGQANMELGSGQNVPPLVILGDYLSEYSDPDFDDQNTYKYKSVTLLPPFDGSGGGGITPFNNQLLLVVDAKMVGQRIDDPNKTIKGGTLGFWKNNGFTYSTGGRGQKMSTTDFDNIEDHRKFVTDRSQSSVGAKTQHNEVLLVGTDPKYIKGFAVVKDNLEQKRKDIQSLFDNICVSRGMCFPVFSYDPDTNELVDITSQFSEENLESILVNNSDGLFKELSGQNGGVNHFTVNHQIVNPTPLMSIKVVTSKNSGNLVVTLHPPGHYTKVTYEFVSDQSSPVHGPSVPQKELTSDIVFEMVKSLTETEDGEMDVLDLQGFEHKYTGGRKTVSLGSLTNSFSPVYKLIQERMVAEQQAVGACQITSDETSHSIKSISQEVDQYSMQSHLQQYQDKVLTAGSADIPIIHDKNEDFLNSVGTIGYPTSGLKLSRQEIKYQMDNTKITDEYTKKYLMSNGMINPRDLIIHGPVYLTGRGLTTEQTSRINSGDKEEVFCISIAGANLVYSQGDITMNERTLKMPSDMDTFAPGGVLNKIKYHDFMEMKWSAMLDIFHQNGVDSPIIPAFGLGAFITNGAGTTVPDAVKVGAKALLKVIKSGNYNFKHGITIALFVGGNKEQCTEFSIVFNNQKDVKIRGTSMFVIASDYANRGMRPGIVNPSDREALVTKNLGQYWYSGHIALEEKFAYTTTLLLSNYALLDKYDIEGHADILSKLKLNPLDDEDKIIEEFQTDQSWLSAIRSDSSIRALLHKFLSGPGHKIGKMRLKQGNNKDLLKSLGDKIKQGITYKTELDELHYLTDLYSLEYYLGLEFNDYNDQKLRSFTFSVRRGLIFYLGYMKSPRAQLDRLKVATTVVHIFDNYVDDPLYSANRMIVWLSGTSEDTNFTQFSNDLGIIVPASQLYVYDIIPSSSGVSVNYSGHGVIGGSGRG
jgi:hypothetical protein